MYKLELDLVLCFVPPMDDGAPGIPVTRTLELPFPPYSDLSLFGREIEDGSEPPGFTLKEVVWDMDRQVFLATTELTIQDLPFEMIPEEIETWIQSGWRLGSYMDRYRQDAEVEEEHETQAQPPVDEREDDSDVMLQRPSQRPNQRSARFNELFGAIVRAMAGSYNNDSVAYAMDKTKVFFAEQQLKDNNSATAQKWIEMRREFDRLPIEKRVRWRERVTKKYSSLGDLIAGGARSKRGGSGPE